MGSFVVQKPKITNSFMHYIKDGYLNYTESLTGAVSQTPFRMLTALHSFQGTGRIYGFGKLSLPSDLDPERLR